MHTVTIDKNDLIDASRFPKSTLLEIEFPNKTRVELVDGTSIRMHNREPLEAQLYWSDGEVAVVFSFRKPYRIMYIPIAKITAVRVEVR